MIEANLPYNRRKFIAASAGTLLAFYLKPISSFASNSTADGKVNELVSKIIGIDSHNHLDVPFNAEEFNVHDYKLRAEILKSGLSAICMTFCVDRPDLLKAGEAYDRFTLSLDEMDQILATNNIKRALNYSDIKNAHPTKTPVVIQCVEGGHFIEGKLERIEVAYKRGLRHLGLLHDNQTTPPLGDIYTDAPKYNGLTELGKNVIKECNRLGILVDLAHCSNDAIDNAIDVSSKPMIISHTGLNTQVGSNERMAKMMMPRLISKEQAQKFAHAGGVIGVWTHIADSPKDLANNIRAMVDVAGIDHVCIGTDTKISFPKKETGRPERTTNQTWENISEGFLYSVVNALLKDGFKETEISKICGKNYFNVFNLATVI